MICPACGGKKFEKVKLLWIPGDIDIWWYKDLKKYYKKLKRWDAKISNGKYKKYRKCQCCKGMGVITDPHEAKFISALYGVL